MRTVDLIETVTQIDLTTKWPKETLDFSDIDSPLLVSRIDCPSIHTYSLDDAFNCICICAHVWVCDYACFECPRASTAHIDTESIEREHVNMLEF